MVAAVGMALGSISKVALGTAKGSPLCRGGPACSWASIESRAWWPGTDTSDLTLDACDGKPGAVSFRFRSGALLLRGQADIGSTDPPDGHWHLSACRSARRYRRCPGAPRGICRRNARENRLRL